MGIRGTHQASQNNGTEEVGWCKEERKGSIAQTIGLAMEIPCTTHNTSMYNTKQPGVYCILL